ncbi:hypothetical protein K1X22_21815 [Mycolicibacterium farcinogenes]|uniref:hypothetical protein n=1 Tax=Mycolicibacterium farcinogenes TaxID=1802 RepID=UPI001C8D3DAA|nr:hypothetical protein [Mycolicibacterium farcinogenes]QZH58867.1 hypothetical protein K1X22_21815 [Mycolicibacterium farcinogenes]
MLNSLAAEFSDPWNGLSRSGGVIEFSTANTFRSEVNRILDVHLVAFHLHSNSQLVPVESHELHHSVMVPALYLLESQARFAGAEKAYQKSLAELRNRDPGDAITDAATALSEVLKALGHEGAALGDQLKSAKKASLVRGADTPLTNVIGRWVATQRNNGEAHVADHEYTMSDAWMVVHVVGALVIRLAESADG